MRGCRFLFPLGPPGVPTSAPPESKLQTSINFGCKGILQRAPLSNWLRTLILFWTMFRTLFRTLFWTLFRITCVSDVTFVWLWCGKNRGGLRRSALKSFSKYVTFIRKTKNSHPAQSETSGANPPNKKVKATTASSIPLELKAFLGTIGSAVGCYFCEISREARSRRPELPYARGNRGGAVITMFRVFFVSKCASGVLGNLSF